MEDNYDLDDMDISEYTSSITRSSHTLSELIESRNTNPLSFTDLLDEQKQPEKPKRGRKPIRINDPIRIKTEEKDKFWLRAFRSYMWKFKEIHWKDFSLEEKNFWKFFFSANGKPGKKKLFLSYGKKYKIFLFSCNFYKTKFKDWFDEKGQELLEKKYKPGSSEFFVYYSYCQDELYHYNETRVSHTQSDLYDDVIMDENFDII